MAHLGSAASCFIGHWRIIIYTSEKAPAPQKLTIGKTGYAIKESLFTTNPLHFELQVMFIFAKHVQIGASIVVLISWKAGRCRGIQLCL